MSNIQNTPLAQLLSTRSNITLKEIGWLAGLLEGEGSFGQRLTKANGEHYYYPSIALTMTDRDSVEKARRLMRAGRIGVGMPRVRIRKKHYVCKKYYACAVSGSKAIAVMMTILPLMSARRTERIKACIAHWKISRQRHQRHTVCQYGHPFSPDNIYLSPSGGRECLLCRLRRNHDTNVRNKLRRLDARRNAPLPVT